MKYMLVSDIHGSLPSLQTVLDIYDKEGCSMLCLLGDIINYGPRNRLPEGLDPAGIVARLNAMSEDIVAVRGNCDSEVDQMLLHFPILADYSVLVDNGRRLFLTHGHVYNEEHRPQCRHNMLVYGHTHLWKLERASDGSVVCNLGSPTFPKGGNVPTFGIYEDGTMSIRNMKGEILKEMEI